MVFKWYLNGIRTLFKQLLIYPEITILQYLLQPLQHGRH